MKRLLHCLFVCLVFGSSTVALAKANPAVQKSMPISSAAPSSK